MKALNSYRMSMASHRGGTLDKQTSALPIQQREPETENFL